VSSETVILFCIWSFIVAFLLSLRVQIGGEHHHFVSLLRSLANIVILQLMVDGVTGRAGLTAPKSVAQEQSIEQDPAQTQHLNMVGETVQGQTMMQ
jgi:hypothetical protein